MNKVFALIRIQHERTRKVFKLKGFTIIELLIVIAILSILMTLLLPALKAAKEKACQIACANNQKQIGLGAGMFANDNCGYLPIGYGKWDSKNILHGLQALITGEYVKGVTVSCPSDKTTTPGGIWGGSDQKHWYKYSFETNNPSYCWNGNTGWTYDGGVTWSFETKPYSIGQLRHPISDMLCGDMEMHRCSNAYYNKSTWSADWWSAYPYPEDWWHSGGKNFLWADGHVERMTITQYEDWRHETKKDF